MLTKTRTYVLMLLPAVLVLMALTLYPFIRAVIISFHDWNLTEAIHPFIGVQNYIQLFNDPKFLNALKVTFYFVVGALTIETSLGVGIASLLNRDWLGFNIIRTLFFVPMLLSRIAVGLIWRFLYRPSYGVFGK